MPVPRLLEAFAQLGGGGRVGGGELVEFLARILHVTGFSVKRGQQYVIGGMLAAAISIRSALSCATTWKRASGAGGVGAWIVFPAIVAVTCQL